MTPVVRIILSDTGRGLWRDAELLAGVVRDAGLEPSIIACAPRSEKQIRWVRRFDKLKRTFPKSIQTILNWVQSHLYRTRPDSSLAVTIHLQQVYSRYVAGGHVNWLVPNAEWYPKERLPYIRLMDLVLCKTRDAVSIFEGYGAPVAYMGFSGSLPDRARVGGNRDYRRFLHVAGNNRKKGTAALVDLWDRNPEWPVLELIIEDHRRLATIPDNIRVHEQVDDATLEALRLSCGIVLAPSEAEGFGHVLLDGQAWGGVVVTVDAPPMNELVQDDRGFLVPWTDSRPCLLGTRYEIDKERLEATIQHILDTDAASLAERSAHAQQWVWHNDELFRTRFSALLEQNIDR